MNWQHIIVQIIGHGEIVPSKLVTKPVFLLLSNYVPMILRNLIVLIIFLYLLVCATKEEMAKSLNGGRFDLMIFDKLLDQSK